MLVGILDSSTFTKFEQLEAEDPSARKEVDGRTIYMSRAMPLSSGEPVLSDLSEARLGDSERTDFIMPDLYRAPEVTLGMPWSYPVDIWGLGMVIWDLFEGNWLFETTKDGHHSERMQLAKMIAIMAPPSPRLLAEIREEPKILERR